MELTAYAPTKLMGLALRVEVEDPQFARIRPTQTLDALHARGLAGAVPAEQTEYLTTRDVERHVGYGDGLAVALA